MSMLAEPRRKKTYVLTPRGKPLYDDESRFGCKMLQKMGWTKGKGLGAKESGEIDFVRLNFKNNSGGLGFEHRDDQWTTHEHGFNGLLQSLNSSTVDKEEDRDEGIQTTGFGFKSEEKSDKEKIQVGLSGESLEEKSKKSKARVHYKKFTRGKDISQYSEKDLANIFGKKSIEIQNMSIDKAENEHENEFENKSTSTTDYFMRKMEKLKKNQIGCNSGLSQVESGQGQSGSSNTITDYFKRKIVDRKTLQNELKVENTAFEKPIEGGGNIMVTHDEEPIRKKRKKDKKSTTKEAPLEAEQLNETYFPVTVKEQKRKKKSKYEVEMPCEAHSACDSKLKTETDINMFDNRISNAFEEITTSKSTKLENVASDVNKIFEETSKSISPAVLDFNVSVDIKDKKEKQKTGKTEHDKLEKKLKNMNAYSISSYAAEQFRNIDFNRFNGCNLAQVIGYSFDTDMKLTIKKLFSDEKRILNLWAGVANKYKETKKEKPHELAKTQDTNTEKTIKQNPKKRNFVRSKYKRKSAFKMSI